MDHVLEHGEEPKSIYSFTKELKIDENEFYKFYTSFDHIESDVLVFFHDETLRLMASETSENELDAKNQLLTFYYTFFELMTNNRSYVAKSLQTGIYDLKKLKLLKPLKEEFKKFIKSLSIETVDLKQDKINSIKEKSIEELAWSQLLFTIKFWLEDTSASFEKTDLFIEKSVNASFDFLSVTPLENLIDFGKFFFKEKIKSKF